MFGIEAFSFVVISFLVKVASITGLLDKLFDLTDPMSMIYLGFSLLYGTLLLTLSIAYKKFNLSFMSVAIVFIISANAMFLIKFNGAWYVPAIVLFPYLLLVKIEHNKS